MTGGSTHPRDVEYDQDEFDQAVAAQRSTIERVLLPFGLQCRTADVLGLLVGDLWSSLGRWHDSAGSGVRPPLGAWANGVARNTAREFLRKENPLRAPGGHRMILLDALPGDALMANEDLVEPDERADAVVRRLKAAVLARPGGSERWALMVRTVSHERRGARMREELRELLGSISGSLPEPLAQVASPQPAVCAPPQSSSRRKRAVAL